MNFSRRQFLKKLAAVGGLFLLGGKTLTQTVFAAEKDDFEILVAGDSLIWGQGLCEEKKFYTLVRNWLENDFFENSRRVKLNVKAHSGAGIEIPPDELEAHENAGDDLDKVFCPEVNISFPSIKKQIEIAAREYENANAVDIVMLNGGVTNIGVVSVVNPFSDEKKFRSLIHRYCFSSMKNLLAQTAETFPAAKIFVIGYFPIVSTKTKVNKISKFVLKIIKFPHFLQFLVTNEISKQFVKILRKAMAKRSKIWFEESNRETSAAIDEVNQSLNEERIFFVESPITEETCYATEKTLLWQLGKDNLPADEKYGERKNECGKVFEETKFDSYGKYSIRVCELASTAHPNAEGSKAYAEAVEKVLELVLMDEKLAVF